MLKKRKLIFLTLLSALLPAVTANAMVGDKIYPRGVVYQSCVSTSAGVGLEKPDSAVIKMMYYIDKKGEVKVTIVNLTDHIMLIDKTMSFFRNCSGASLSYYDPTVSTHTTSSTSTSSTGVGVNLGAVAGAAGVRGPIGQALNGITVGGSNGSAYTSTNTTYDIDQPTIAIGPRGQVALSKEYETLLGSAVTKLMVDKVVGDSMNNTFSPENSYITFGVYVTYSVDNGQTWKRVDADFYANTMIVCKVTKEYDMNSAVEALYRIKPDVFAEPWMFMYFDVGEKTKKSINKSASLSDFYCRMHTFVKYQ